MQKQKSTIKNDELSFIMQLTLGAAVVAMVTSLGSQNIHPAITNSHEAASNDVVHKSEHPREVLHGHISLGRTRSAAVAGTS